jgi:hypothetical protein
MFLYAAGSGRIFSASSLRHVHIFSMSTIVVFIGRSGRSLHSNHAKCYVFIALHSRRAGIRHVHPLVPK